MTSVVCGGGEEVVAIQPPRAAAIGSATKSGVRRRMDSLRYGCRYSQPGSGSAPPAAIDPDIAAGGLLLPMTGHPTRCRLRTRDILPIDPRPVVSGPAPV